MQYKCYIEIFLLLDIVKRCCFCSDLMCIFIVPDLEHFTVVVKETFGLSLHLDKKNM